MKVKTSITLDEDTLRAIDEIVRPPGNRSRIIELAIAEFIERRRREAREARDLQILNEHAERLNQEAEDVLSYQAEV